MAFDIDTDTTTHRFVDHGGEVCQEGKGYWPDFLRVDMDAYRAWAMVRELLTQLERGEESLQVTLFGQLTQEEEE